ncbi:MAG: hypothetical protein E7514_01955 [Ruminococcaceae bacterium]|nr:hypothetical protein [Oscillospiraceae bacterium]
MNNSKKSAKTALGGVIAALSVVLMFMTSVIPTLTYALPAAAGVLLSIIVIEIDKKWAFAVYAAVSLLSVLLVADKEAAVMYIMFFGYYPILKAVFEKHFSVPVSWVLKFIDFNISMILAFLISVYVFKIPFDEMEKYGPIAAFILLGVGNIVFLLYDFALSNLIKLYLFRWQKRLKKIFKY